MELQESGLISGSPGGLDLMRRPKKTKVVADIYENIQIPFAPSYFSALLHSQGNPNFPLTMNISPVCNEKEGNSSSSSICMVICGDSVADASVIQRNRRIWKSIEGVPTKVWKSIEDLGIEGDEDD